MSGECQEFALILPPVSAGINTNVTQHTDSLKAGHKIDQSLNILWDLLDLQFKRKNPTRHTSTFKDAFLAIANKAFIADTLLNAVDFGAGGIFMAGGCCAYNLPKGIRAGAAHSAGISVVIIIELQGKKHPRGAV